jgi:hypothetical protein
VGRTEGTAQHLLWTIEVKVGSPFHHSAAQRSDDEDEESSDEPVSPEIEPELVNQLKHYDDWLDKQPHQHRGGFVLSMSDLEPLLPPLNLKQRWTCLTWTKLGLAIKTMIDDGHVSADEMLLAKHLLGFISTNLWRRAEMPAADRQLNFNDVALMRAFVKIGEECDQKIKDLLLAASALITESSIGVGAVSKPKKFFRPEGYANVWRWLVPGWETDYDPWIYISFCCEEPNEDYFDIGLSMSSDHPKVDAVRKAASLLYPKLTERNSRWKQGTGEADDFTIVRVSYPLTSLLAVDNQHERFTELIRSGLNDLKTTGVVTAIANACGSKATSAGAE